MPHGDTSTDDGGAEGYEVKPATLQAAGDASAQYAMNDFRYRVVGRSVTTGGRKQVHYTVGVLKPYVFGPPRNPIPIPVLSKIIPGAKVDQKAIEHLHRAGLAQNFIIQGLKQYVAGAGWG